MIRHRKARAKLSITVIYVPPTSYLLIYTFTLNLPTTFFTASYICYCLVASSFFLLRCCWTPHSVCIVYSILNFKALAFQLK